MVRFIAVIFFFVSWAVSFGQDEGLQKSEYRTKFPGVPQDLHEKSEVFFNKIIRSDIDGAFDEFLKDSPINTRKDQLKKLIQQARRSIELYGKMMANQAVSSEIVSNSFIRLRYLGLHTKYPLRWIITFYKSPEKGWIIINIRFDDQSKLQFYRSIVFI